MHVHIVNYCNENYKVLSRDLKGTLKIRDLDLAGYLYKMQNTMMSGFRGNIIDIISNVQMWHNGDQVRFCVVVT